MDSLLGSEDTVLKNRSKIKAELYLEEKHVMPLVNHLTSSLLIHEPKDPIEFLLHQVKDIIHFRNNRGKPPILFNNDHLTNVFKGVDFLNKGTIDLSQYSSAMKMLGLNENDFNQNPQVDENNQIECKIFVYEAGLTSDSSEHSVRPVRLDRCWAGTVRWSYPRGALRVVFRLTGTSGGREFRVCLKPDRLDGVRVLLDSAPRRLIAVYDYRTAGEPLRSRCFKSVGGTAAFYVEADKTGDRSGPVRFRYDLEPLAEPAPQLFIADNLDDECRPCTVEEMTQAYCTSSLVVQGTIVGVSYDGDVSRVRVMPTKAHRLPPEEDDRVVVQVSSPQQQQEDESGRPRRDDRPMTITFGRGCRPAAGPGEFVFMARAKFDELALRCAPRLEEWRQAVKADKAPGCILAG